MGNTESNVTSGVKKQAGTSEQPVYKLVDLKGGGLLVDMMKRATQTKQYAELDHAIKTKVEPFLYNKGKGRLIPVSQLVLLRNCERSRTKLVITISVFWGLVILAGTHHAATVLSLCGLFRPLPIFLLPPLKNMEDPESEFDMDRDGDPGDFQPAPDGVQEDFHDLNRKYRDVCWDLKKRGAVGETCLHLCMLNATSLHADLAKRLLKFYPKLINDIYMSDEYYGENVLHWAIVNEDPAMVKFLLDCGANFHERCCGNFMCAEDQKATRTDSLDHEYVNLAPETNYQGYVYWGEYPLSFAACLGQEESYRLMLAKGANPDNQDTNGNTALHMLVIHNKLGMFDVVYEMGANLSLKNVKNLTPLTLAAKLARVEMFFHILNIEREIYWQIGSITCAAYPLSQIDTIDNETGNISKNSALNLVVFGDKDEHLELMDGVLVDLLVAKWNTYVKFRWVSQLGELSLAEINFPFLHLTFLSEGLSERWSLKLLLYFSWRFYRQFISFFFYFLISLVCFTLRPGPPGGSIAPAPSNATSIEVINATAAAAAAEVLNVSTTTGAPLRNASRLTDNKSSEWKSFSGEEIREKSRNGSAEEPLRGRTSAQESKAIRKTSLGSDNKIIFEEPRESETENGKAVGKETKIAVSRNESEELVTEFNLINARKSSTPATVTNGETSFERNSTKQGKRNETEVVDGDEPDCRLWSYEKTEDKIRIAAEVAMEVGCLLYILAALREARFLGIHMFIENLMTAPSRVMFLSSCCIMQLVPWLRFTCQAESEDIVAVIIMLTTAPYFLFFCRGFKTVGPFVVMIYRMIRGDLLRFVCIYTVFVMGFSQAYYIIFLSFDNPKTPDGVDDSSTNPMQSPVESIMAMFLMSLTNFGEYYGSFEKTEHEFVAKLMFVIYMGIVAILLVNMLIAMMGNTYQKIAETRNEWQRQWARIVLVVERGVSPHERLKKLMLYSQPMSDGRRALVLRLHQTPEDKEEMKDILDMKRVHNRMVQRRKAKGTKNAAYAGSPKHGAKHHLLGPVPPLKCIPPKPSA